MSLFMRIKRPAGGTQLPSPPKATFDPCGSCTYIGYIGYIGSPAEWLGKILGSQVWRWFLLVFLISFWRITIPETNILLVVLKSGEKTS